MILVITVNVGTFLKQRLDQKEDVGWYSFIQPRLSTIMASQSPLKDSTMLSSLLFLDPLKGMLPIVTLKKEPKASQGPG